jgi:hypothetical protein
MAATVWTLTLVLFAADDGASPAETPRKPNPFAPSLRLLTEEEETQLDRVIDRFIQFDTGQLRGQEGKKAVSEFHKLGPDAIPALIRGINRAAKIEASCPAVTIGRKLATLLRVSRDPELLQFASENIGAGITQSRHMGVLRELRVMCNMRKSNMPPVTALRATLPTLGPRIVSASQLLLEAADLPPGPRRSQLTANLDASASKDIVNDLGAVAGDGSNQKTQQLAREFLEQLLARQSATELKAKLQDDQVEVRIAAARVVGQRKLHFETELIDLLSEDNGDACQAARRALAELNPGTDFGPDRNAGVIDRAETVTKWRAWLAKQNRR